MKVSATVQKVVYPKEGAEGNWYIIVTDKGSMKGPLQWRPQVKERLTFDGDWTVYQGNREFKFKRGSVDIPVSMRDRLHYVCELASGIGAALEQAIWDKYGEDYAKAKPGELPRFGAKAHESFQKALEALEMNVEMAKAVSFLMSNGCTLNMSEVAYKTWKDDTIGVVKGDCYRLSELPNYSFVDVDRMVAPHFNITDSDDRRIRAGVLYSVKQLTSSGSTVVNWQDLLQQSIKNLGGFSQLVSDQVKFMFDEYALRGFADTKGVSLDRDYRNEEIIWEFINK